MSWPGWSRIPAAWSTFNPDDSRFAASSVAGERGRSRGDDGRSGTGESRQHECAELRCQLVLRIEFDDLVELGDGRLRITQERVMESQQEPLCAIGGILCHRGLELP